MTRTYDSKHVETPGVGQLDRAELASLLGRVLEFLGKEVVRTSYSSHGDDPINEITIADIGKTQTGVFDGEI